MSVSVRLAISMVTVRFLSWADNEGRSKVGTMTKYPCLAVTFAIVEVCGPELHVTVPMLVLVSAACFVFSIAVRPELEKTSPTFARR